MTSLPSDVLLFGIMVFSAGGLLAMRGVVKHDAAAAPPQHEHLHMAFRHTLPRHGLCPVGLALMAAGALCVLGSYLARF